MIRLENPTIGKLTTRSIEAYGEQFTAPLNVWNQLLTQVATSARFSIPDVSTGALLRLSPLHLKKLQTYTVTGETVAANSKAVMEFILELSSMVQSPSGVYLIDPNHQSPLLRVDITDVNQLIDTEFNINDLTGLNVGPDLRVLPDGSTVELGGVNFWERFDRVLGRLNPSRSFYTVSVRNDLDFQHISDIVHGSYSEDNPLIEELHYRLDNMLYDVRDGATDGMLFANYLNLTNSVQRGSTYLMDAASKSDPKMYQTVWKDILNLIAATVVHRAMVVLDFKLTVFKLYYNLLSLRSYDDTRLDFKGVAYSSRYFSLMERILQPRKIAVDFLEHSFTNDDVLAHVWPDEHELDQFKVALYSTTFASYTSQSEVKFSEFPEAAHAQTSGEADHKIWSHPLATTKYLDGIVVHATTANAVYEDVLDYELFEYILINGVNVGDVNAHGYEVARRNVPPQGKLTNSHTVFGVSNDSLRVEERGFDKMPAQLVGTALMDSAVVPIGASWTVAVPENVVRSEFNANIVIPEHANIAITDFFDSRRIAIGDKVLNYTKHAPDKYMSYLLDGRSVLSTSYVQDALLPKILFGERVLVNIPVFEQFVLVESGINAGKWGTLTGLKLGDSIKESKPTVTAEFKGPESQTIESNENLATDEKQDKTDDSAE